MKKSRFAIFLGILLSVFLVLGCSSGSSGSDSNSLTVTFNDNGSVTRTVKVASGEKIAEPSEPSKEYNYFMYWSKSKASKADATEFDFTKPITENTTLYAIYTPKLTSSAIQTITKETIVIKLYDAHVFPLTDGSYAGINFLYSSKGNNYSDYEPFNLSVPSSYEDKDGYRYLTYTFATPLTARRNYFKVTNDHETSEKSFISDITPEKLRTITFDDNKGTTKSEDIEAGETATKPSNPYKSGSYFMYWSKANSAEEASEFDFSTPITENTTLYAIYTPKLDSVAIKEISESDITITLYWYNSDLFYFEDGSLAGIKFQHSTDDVNYQDFAVERVPEKKSTYNLIYTFTKGLAKGHHYLKVTNGHETYTKEVDVAIGAEDIRKVTFDDNGTKNNIKVEAGKTVTKPSDPYKSYNYFMYWSKSKESLDKIEEFDFTTPITENITLYSIYTPRLASSSIQSISATEIEIKLYDDDVFPLDDGSYAGIKFQHSNTNSNYEDFTLPLIPSDTRDSGGYRYLTYSFAEPLSYGDHYFIVTNDEETYPKNATIAAPAPVTNLSVDVADSYAKVSFKTIAGWTSYTVKALKNGTELASKQISSSYSGIKYVEFFGLSNGSEYTFKVLTDKTDKYAETTATPEITKKTSDWVVAMYMDGDNDLHEPIYLDMNEAEYGLCKIRNSDGITPGDSFSSVNVIALWDGAVSWKEIDKKTGKEVTVTPQIGRTGTYLFELGTDTSNSTLYTDSAGCVLSENTKNLSYTADWIVSEKTVSTSQPTSYGEVNMGSKQTLEKFLKWVNAHYTANKGIILQFSDHGGGPRRARYVETPDGRIIKVGDLSGRRALCWDESSGSSYLKTKDVSQALNEAGFGTNKASIILMDLCLGSSVEDAYQFKDYAEYYAASPNTIPALGLNYVYLMQSFKKNTTTEAIAKQILLDYKKQYSSDYDMWDSLAQKLTGNDNATYASLTDTQKEIIEWAGDLGITTFTITDLSKIDAVKDAINTLCDVLLSAEGKAQTIYVDDNGIACSTITSKTENYVSYLGQHYANVTNFFLSKPWYSISDTMYYMGSYTWLYDIAYMVINMEYDSRATISGETNENAWTELNTAASNVLVALNDAIKYSWRDSKSATYLHNNDFYYKLDSNSSYEHYFGLTICGSNIATNGGNLAQGSAPDFYKTDLEFGQDSKWGDLLEYWFGE